MSESEREVKVFLLERVAGHLSEAYRNFLSLEDLLTEQEREKIRFWKLLRQLHLIKERTTNTHERYKKGL